MVNNVSLNINDSETQYMIIIPRNREYQQGKYM